MRSLPILLVLVVACSSDGGTAQPPFDPGAAELSPDEQDVLDEINAERLSRGLSAVILRDDLRCAAVNHSADIGERQECTHDSPNGDGPGDRVDACGGGGWSGEIVACGQTTGRSAVEGWLGSPGHHDIMLDPEQKRVGVAMHGNFWTAIFDRND